MGLALEVLDLIMRILWCYLESAYRLIVPVPRKRINGEIALITGGGGKIGECIAMELAKENVTIVLWDINDKACDRVANKLRKEGATAHAYKCDLTDRNDVYSVAKKVEEEVGHVTILINNAGILITRRFSKCTDGELAKQVEINTIAHFWTTKAFLPHMEEMNYGHIVTVASMAGIAPVSNLVGYCTSKFGAIGFHKALTTELMTIGKSGVKTTCLCPIMVDTPLIGKVTSRFQSLLPILKPEVVAKELVDGMLRNKSMVLVPKTVRINLMIQNFLPEKAVALLHKFYAVVYEEETAEVMIERREKAALLEEKKVE